MAHRKTATAKALCRRMTVEVDGGQHSESELDRSRDAGLQGHGYRVLRF